jgi:putative endonuclease
MTSHIELGRLGEQMAEDYLIEKGYTILRRNYRHEHNEIDIIALKDDIPHVVEVKIRSSNLFGHPEESVKKKKIKSLMKVADEFLHKNRQYKNFHIDILSITLRTPNDPEYFLIEDVYL